MEQSTKHDLKQLEERLKSIEERIQHKEEQLIDSTVGQYVKLMSEINALRLREEATKDAISRISNRNFSKNAPDRHITVSLTTLNKFQR
jgi:predicted  nucleic acid-binding Zn-ribbon protein